jgi:hypothetical protein
MEGHIAKYAMIPAKDTIHLKSQLVTRYPTTNRNPRAGNNTAKVLRPATIRFSTKVMNARWENTTEPSQGNHK